MVLSGKFCCIILMVIDLAWPFTFGILTSDSLSRYTNYESQKAQQISENPSAALLFYWDGLNRQVSSLPQSLVKCHKAVVL